MKSLLLSAMLSVFALPVFADEPSHQKKVITCLSFMDQGTTWEQCRTALFAPCATTEVGGESHLACLAEQRSDWQDELNSYNDRLGARLTADGNIELSKLLGQWFGYIGNKCNEVANSKTDISAKAALQGCEISEFAGLSAEFEACLDGRSNAPYCVLKD